VVVDLISGVVVSRAGVFFGSISGIVGHFNEGCGLYLSPQQ
jgi:hypothetical protein